MIGVIYEDLPNVVSYFTNARGIQDATNAFNTAVAMGQPTGSAIYFAVDYNAPTADISGPILDYFNGVSQGMQTSSAGGAITYAIGVYGSGDVCDFIKGQSNLAKYSWLSESTSWFGKCRSSWEAQMRGPISIQTGGTNADERTRECSQN